MIVDAHVHLAASGSAAEDVLKAPSSPELLLRQMDRSGIDAAVVLGLPGIQTPEEVLELCGAAPGRLFPLLGIDPRNPNDLAGIENARERGFYGLKLHPRLNRYAVDDSILDPVLTKATEARLAIVLDSLPQCSEIPLERMGCQAFDRLARRFPNVRLVLAHACAPHVLEAFTLVKANKNAFLDVSFSLDYYAGTSVVDDLAFISDKLDRRTLYGSDFPQCAADRYLHQYQSLLRRVPAERHAALLGANAISLFGLPIC
jgi:hypothetical protein